MEDTKHIGSVSEAHPGDSKPEELGRNSGEENLGVETLTGLPLAYEAGRSWSRELSGP